MTKFVFFILVLIFVIGYVSHISTIRIPENQRVVILNLGKFKKIIGPEGGSKIPVMDVAIPVDLTKHVPGWHSMSEKEIQKQVKELVFKDPDPTKYI